MSNNLIANRHDTTPKAGETDTKASVNTKSNSDILMA